VTTPTPHQSETPDGRRARWETAAFVAGREVDRNALAAYMSVADAELRAVAKTFRDTFGDVLVCGRDGNWANVADWIATGARIPACGSFYPPATDTRCVLHKGHQGNHRAPWGDRTMAWPYDPRETQQPIASGDGR
jgi:hypothetical protein